MPRYMHFVGKIYPAKVRLACSDGSAQNQARRAGKDVANDLTAGVQKHFSTCLYLHYVVRPKTSSTPRMLARPSVSLLVRKKPTTP